MALVEIVVNFPWAICIAREDAGSLAAIRLISGIEVGETVEAIWLRGQRGDETLEAKLSALPASARYEWLVTNRLRQINERVPSDTLPSVQWQRLDTWLQVEMPAAAIPADAPVPVPLRLTRSTVEQLPELLLARVDDLTRFAAARVRLEPLQFAASLDGDALVRGRPLPPIPGRRFVIHGRVAVPVGFSWEPKVSVEVLGRRFGVSGDALIVWNENGTLTRLHSEQFVALSRSALRATRQALAEAS